MQHPNYNRDTEENDIALVKVSTIIRFKKGVQHANLQMNLNDEDEEVKLIVTGWSRSECKY